MGLFGLGLALANRFILGIYVELVLGLTGVFFFFFLNEKRQHFS